MEYSAKLTHGYEMYTDEGDVAMEQLANKCLHAIFVDGRHKKFVIDNIINPGITEIIKRGFKGVCDSEPRRALAFVLNRETKKVYGESFNFDSWDF